MPNTEHIRMVNGGIPRRLTFELLREMHMQIWKATGRKPQAHEIRCAVVQRENYIALFDEKLHMSMIEHPAVDGVSIVVDIAGTVPADQMEWWRDGRLIAILADLQT